MRWRLDAKNNPRDYGIARKFWVGITGRKNTIGDPRLCFGELEVTFLSQRRLASQANVLLARARVTIPYFVCVGRLQCLLSKQSYFVYLKNLDAEKLVWLQAKTLYLALDIDQEIQLHVTLYPTGNAISSARVARLPSR